jgi:peptide-methionine (R)-S-oxide reductase
MSRLLPRVALLALLVGCMAPARAATPSVNPPAPTTETTPVTHTEAEWKQLLSPNAFYILRQKGTERAGTGAYAQNHDKGTYYCGGCGALLFSSEDKFESGTGWPSFTRPAEASRVKLTSDTSLFSERTEVTCARCGGHLGHVFDDGPAPTGKRFCMNSAALNFVPGPARK